MAVAIPLLALEQDDLVQEERPTVRIYEPPKSKACLGSECKIDPSDLFELRRKIEVLIKKNEYNDTIEMHRSGDRVYEDHAGHILARMIEKGWSLSEIRTAIYICFRERSRHTRLGDTSAEMDEYFNE